MLTYEYIEAHGCWYALPYNDDEVQEDEEPSAPEPVTDDDQPF